MHKLSKGLKKKIKGKKSKEKEEELDHAELVKLRREAQEAAESAAAKAAANADANANASDPAEGDSEATGHQPTASENKPESEEWLKFKLLTSGVDDILAKTQEDLDRIKSTSYFQRKKPTTPLTEEVKSVVSPSSTAAANGKDDAAGQVTSWVGFGEGSKGLEEEEAEQELREAHNNRRVATLVESPEQPVEEQVTFELPEEEELTDEQEEDEDDIFDTAYVDVVTSGELKFAYVPDSPTQESAAGDDPFDTSNVDKIIGPVVVAKPKKQLVSIGAAAHILNTTERPRRSVQPPTELELFSFGDEDLPPATSSGASLPVETSGNDLFDLPNDETKPQTPPTPPPAGTPDIKDILAEFDAIPESAELITEELFEKPVEESLPVADNPPAAAVPAPLIDEEDFEFEALALESLSKDQPDDWEVPIEEDDPFDTSCVDKVLHLPPEPPKKPGPPARPVAPSRPAAPAKSPIDPPNPANPISDDPFDTSQVKEQLSINCRPERPKSPAPPGRPKSAAPPGRSNSPAALDRPKSPAPPGRPKSPAVPERPKSPAPSRLAASPAVEQSIPLKAQDSFDAAFLSDEGEADPFDTSAASHLVLNTTIDQTASLPEPVATLSFLDPDDLEIEENDPFDTSAVVLN